MQSPTHAILRKAHEMRSARSEFFMTIFGLVTVLYRYRTTVYTRNPILFRDTHLT